MHRGGVVMYGFQMSYNGNCNFKCFILENKYRFENLCWIKQNAGEYKQRKCLLHAMK